jgi:hypothetical protein
VPDQPVIGILLTRAEWGQLFEIQDAAREDAWKLQTAEAVRVQLGRQALRERALEVSRSPLLQALQRQREQGGWRPSGE